MAGKHIDRLVIASNNPKKRKEIEAILTALDIAIVPAEDTVFVDVIEDGETFADNARKKAVAFMQANQLPALADDSGLSVPALNGAPGVHSARYAGENAIDSDNNRKLLSDLTGVKDRSAYFSCALHLATPAGDHLCAVGRVEGVILEELSGDTGFGYDPLFFSPELNLAFAQSTQEQKASVSHRGRALRKLKNLLEQ